MVLFIDQNVVESVPKTLQEFLNHYPSLYNRSKNFALLPVQPVDPCFSLYVGQGEFAVVPKCDKILKVIGSDDATTCHIIILKDSYGNVAVAHFDGNGQEYESLQTMTTELQTFNGSFQEPVEVFVVGGYRSDSENISNTSESLSLKILKYLCSIDVPLSLQILCTVDLNTKSVNGNPFPIFYGVAVSQETGEVFPANFSVPVPNHILRSASMWVTGSQGPQSPRNIYDYQNHSVTVLPFKNWNQKDFEFYSTLPSHVIMKYFSTSPLVEPPSFIGRLRSVFNLLGSYTSEEIFPGNKSKVYKITNSGEWQDVSQTVVL